MKALRNPWKQLLKTLCVCSFTLGVAVTLFAQGPLLTFDELGNGTYQLGGVTNTLASWLGPDPTGGVQNWNVLIYQLPFTGVMGDVLFDFDGVETNVAYGGDVVRFTETGLLIFYSDAPPFDAPGDTPGPPNPLLNNQVSVVEQVQGTEEGNEYSFATYTPVVGQPGYDVTNPNYLFISDIPEPGTLAVAGLGFAGLALMAYRRRGK